MSAIADQILEKVLTRLNIEDKSNEEKFNNIFAELHELTDEALKEGLSIEQVQKLLQ